MILDVIVKGFSETILVFVFLFNSFKHLKCDLSLVDGSSTEWTITLLVGLFVERDVALEAFLVEVVLDTAAKDLELAGWLELS